MDKRDGIWNKVFEIFYDSFYFELLSSKIASKWLFVDEITKILVAITTSGSAIAGWSLWNKEGFQFIWIFLAGTGALLSVLHATLNVSNRVKEWTDMKRKFSSLKIECETNRGIMEMNPEFEIESHTNFYIEKKRVYGELYSNLPNDFLISKKFRINIQEEVNHSISNLIT